MRLRLPIPLLAAAALALGACGSSDPEPTAATTTPAAERGTFPATVEHRYGTTTVPRRPQRIVSVGYTEQDTLLALGEVPVATTEWYGEQPYAVWPWARDELGDARPEVLSLGDGFQLEKIAALRPDLIVGTNAGMKRSDYEKLSRIAPTVAAPKGSSDVFSPWDQQTVTIATALGRPAAGRAIVARIRAAFAAARRAHPEFAGRTVTFTQNAFYDGLIYTYPEGLNTEFLTDLGFRIAPAITRLREKAGEQVTLSPERVDLLEADALLFATEKPSDVAALDRVPTFRALDGVRENRAVFTDGTLAGAIYFTSPLSLPYVLERLVPQLERALQGRAPHRVVTAGGSR